MFQVSASYASFPLDVARLYSLSSNTRTMGMYVYSNNIVYLFLPKLYTLSLIMFVEWVVRILTVSVTYFSICCQVLHQKTICIVIFVFVSTATYKWLVPIKEFRTSPGIPIVIITPWWTKWPCLVVDHSSIQPYFGCPLTILKSYHRVSVFLVTKVSNLCYCVMMFF